MENAPHIALDLRLLFQALLPILRSVGDIGSLAWARSLLLSKLLGLGLLDPHTKPQHYSDSITWASHIPDAVLIRDEKLHSIKTLFFLLVPS